MKHLAIIALLALTCCGGQQICNAEGVCIEVTSESPCLVTYCNRWTNPEHTTCKEWKTQRTWCRQ